MIWVSDNLMGEPIVWKFSFKEYSPPNYDARFVVQPKHLVDNTNGYFKRMNHVDPFFFCIKCSDNKGISSSRYFLDYAQTFHFRVTLDNQSQIFKLFVVTTRNNKFFIFEVWYGTILGCWLPMRCGAKLNSSFPDLPVPRPVHRGINILTAPRVRTCNQGRLMVEYKPVWISTTATPTFCRLPHHQARL